MPSTTWTVVNNSSTAWTIVEGSFKHLWSDWSSLTWGQIESSGISWAAMAGDTFIDATSPTTTWTIQT